MIGRDKEITAVLGFTSGVLVITGGVGAGKSSLLEVAAAAAEPDRRVLRAADSRSESNLPFSGLHQLLQDVLDEIHRLPQRQRTALSSAVDMAAGVPEPMMVGLAALTLLSELSDRTRLLLMVDDIDLFDDCSRDVLAFIWAAARRD